MNLKQLKGMIAEEYRYWLAEQPIDAPGVEVGPNDVDVMGGDDSEATLRQIYDMLKSYFEGGNAGDAMMDDPADDAADKAPKAPKTPKAPKADKKDDTDKDDKDKEDLKERFKKLANIIKG